MVLLFQVPEFALYNHRSYSSSSYTLCCFVVYSTRRFVVCLSVCHFVLVFYSPFSIAITSLGEERANLSAFCTFVRFVLVWILSVSSSSWGLGRAAVCDCGTPWTLLLPFFCNLWRLIGFVCFLFLLVTWKGCGLWLCHSLDFSGIIFCNYFSSSLLLSISSW